MSVSRKVLIPYVLVGVWFAFTVSLAGWWYLFAIEQTRRLVELEHLTSPALARHLSMLSWEGLTLMLCIVVGASAMTYYIFREMRQSNKLQVFFSTFTHELRTPLASLRLQAESLKEDLSGTSHSQIVDRLVSDTHRLSMQLENSLFLAQEGSTKLFPESLNLVAIINDLRQHWPNIEFSISGQGVIVADRRSIECVLTNLISNSSLHGKAQRVEFKISPLPNGNTLLCVSDNGTGVTGDSSKIGKLFARLYPGSGNGIGLYLVRRLVHEMYGKVNFQSNSNGFITTIHLPGANL